jgi:hypothetical protein
MPKIFHFLGITLMHELHAIYASNKIFSKCDSVGMLDVSETNRRRRWGQRDSQGGAQIRVWKLDPRRWVGTAEPRRLERGGG